MNRAISAESFYFSMRRASANPDEVVQINNEAPLEEDAQSVRELPIRAINQVGESILSAMGSTKNWVVQNPICASILATTLISGSFAGGALLGAALYARKGASGAIQEVTSATTASPAVTVNPCKDITGIYIKSPQNGTVSFSDFTTNQTIVTCNLKEGQFLRFSAGDICNQAPSEIKNKNFLFTCSDGAEYKLSPSDRLPFAGKCTAKLEETSKAFANNLRFVDNREDHIVLAKSTKQCQFKSLIFI